MDEALRAKLDEARARLNSRQAGIDEVAKTRIAQHGSGREENSDQQMQNARSLGTR
jgi:hypothetical protein